MKKMFLLAGILLMPLLCIARGGGSAGAGDPFGEHIDAFKNALESYAFDEAAKIVDEHSGLKDFAIVRLRMKFQRLLDEWGAYVQYKNVEWVSVKPASDYRLFAPVDYLVTDQQWVKYSELIRACESALAFLGIHYPPYQLCTMPGEA